MELEEIETIFLNPIHKAEMLQIDKKCYNSILSIVNIVCAIVQLAEKKKIKGEKWISNCIT